MVTCPICRKKASQSYQKNNFSYYFCNNCQTLFLSPKPRINKLISYYKQSFDYSAGLINQNQIKQRVKIIIQNLKKLYPQGKTLLDIGSAYGYFLNEAKKNKLQPLGIEPSKYLFEYSNKQNIVKVLNTTFENYYKKYKYKKFDFLTLIHVIEHVRNPVLWIKMAFSLLNQQGILYIETPNLDSHLFEIEKENYTFLIPPEHLWLFSPKSFRYISSRYKEIDLVRISTYSLPEHLMGIIKSNIKNPHFVPTGAGTARGRQKSIKWTKYLIFDKFLAPLFTPLLNIGNKGSILELYIKKLK